MFEAVEGLVDEHSAIEQQLAAPDVFSDPVKSRKLNQRYSALTAVVRAYHEWQSTVGHDVCPGWRTHCRTELPMTNLQMPLPPAPQASTVQTVPSPMY